MRDDLVGDHHVMVGMGVGNQVVVRVVQEGRDWCGLVAGTRVLARHTEPYLTAYDLSHLDAYQVACRLVVGGRDLHAFTLRTRPMPPAVPGRAAEARKHARKNAGRTQTDRRHDLLVRRRRHRTKTDGDPGGVSSGVSDGVLETPTPPRENRQRKALPTPASEDPDSWSNP